MCEKNGCSYYFNTAHQTEEQRKMDLHSILDSVPEPPIVDLHLDEINKSGEYNLPTPMFEFQKELTDQIVSLHYSDILKYCETNDTTELIIKSLQICVENCMLVATHPYLLIQHYMPKNLSMRDLPAKLAETSGKFNVIKDLINVIVSNKVSPLPKHVGMVMNNNVREMDLLEALILGCRGSKVVQRYVGNSIKRENTKNNKNNAKTAPPLTIHMIPQDGQLTRNETELENVKFDCIIVMDGHVDTLTQFFKNLRQQKRRGEECLMVRLIPIYSIEHCLLHYKGIEGEPSYLYKLISSIVCLRDRIGNLQPDIFPIYNQSLTYLSHTFFDHIFRRDIRSFPSWPLPELPKIPRFSPTDVERSLLTEVVYHYTPYDSNEAAIEASAKCKSYYQTKRLQLDYVTNPLKNDYNILSGIHNHEAVSKRRGKDRTILTHKLILELNAGYLDLAKIQEEYHCYIEYNKDERQSKIGRRIDDMKKSLTSIVSDVDHVEQRIQVNEKKLQKRQEEMEVLKTEIEHDKEKLRKFSESETVTINDIKKTFVENQLKIWDLQNEVKEKALKVQTKNDELSYTKKEIENCETSIKQSEEQVSTVREKIAELEKQIESARQSEEEENVTFKKRRLDSKSGIDGAIEENTLLKTKLVKSLKFLKDTSHLKSRKGRGLTPNNR